MIKKVFIIWGIFGLIFPLNVAAQQRQGVTLLVFEKDGGSIQGELIAVKTNSLLLLSSEGRDETINIDQVKEIRVVKKSKWLLGAGIGGAAGALGGALLLNNIWYVEHGDKTKGEAALQSGIVFGSLGLLLGGMTGAFAGQDNIYKVASYQQTEIQVVLKKLAKQARVPEYQ